jgi:flagellar L-ring protein precursor FlgH
MHRSLLTVALALGLCVPASADTLYQAAPPPAAPGHPLRLGADHKAQQVGDLVHVVYNFAVNSTSSAQTSVQNSHQLSLAPGVGLANVSLLRFGAGLQNGRQTTDSKTQTGQNTFVSSMEAQVTNILPSGALQIAGDQLLSVNGQRQTLHITGVVRTEDIDSTDSVQSDHIANVQATFSGNFQDKNKGLIQHILDFLF